MDNARLWLRDICKSDTLKDLKDVNLVERLGGPKPALYLGLGFLAFAYLIIQAISGYRAKTPLRTPSLSPDPEKRPHTRSKAPDRPLGGGSSKNVSNTWMTYKPPEQYGIPRTGNVQLHKHTPIGP